MANLPNQYQRTVSITPSSNAYTWDTPPSWITVVRVGSTDEWTITVLANNGASRTHSLTVRHDNTTTIDSILVSQAAGSGPTATPVPNPTATSVPNPTATLAPNPTATLAPNPTATLAPNPTATPGQTASFTFSTNTNTNNRFMFTGSMLYTDVAYTIIGNGIQSPANPANFTSNEVTGANLAGPTLNNAGTFYTGTYRFTKQFSPNASTNVNCTVIGPYGSTQDTWYCTLEGGSHSPVPPTSTPVPDSGSGSGPTATPIPPTATPLDSGSGSGPTATPVPFPTSTPYVSGYTGGGGGCHLAGEMITMSNGEKVAVENIIKGDSLLSVNISGMSNEELAYKTWNETGEAFSTEYTNVNVANVKVDTYTSYYNFNDGALKITYEHPILVKTTNDLVLFKIAKDVVLGDKFLNEDNAWISVNTKSLVEAAIFATYTIDVEPEDTYFANGILVHNIEEQKDENNNISNFN